MSMEATAAPFSSSIVSPRSYIVSSPNSLFLSRKNATLNFKSPRSLTIRASSSSSDSVVTLLDYGAGNALGFTIKDVLRYTSENVFVPLTVGGGIRDFTDASGRSYSSLEVAAEYFRSGADKISIGSDAVYAAHEFIKSGVIAHTSSLARSDRTEFLDLMLDDVYHLSRSTKAP